jgi:hypothetical protein
VVLGLACLGLEAVVSARTPLRESRCRLLACVGCPTPRPCLIVSPPLHVTTRWVPSVGFPTPPVSACSAPDPSIPQRSSVLSSVFLFGAHSAQVRIWDASDYTSPVTVATRVRAPPACRCLVYSLSHPPFPPLSPPPTWLPFLPVVVLYGDMALLFPGCRAPLRRGVLPRRFVIRLGRWLPAVRGAPRVVFFFSLCSQGRGQAIGVWCVSPAQQCQCSVCVCHVFVFRCHHSETGEHLWTIADGHRGGMTSLALSGNERFTVSSFACSAGRQECLPVLHCRPLAQAGL